jgi:DNA-binding NarL/FixJ family response regulator
VSIKVLVVDDHAAIRAGLVLILGNAEGIEVVGEAGDGATAIRQAKALRPDVVLMDIRMPGLDGIAATRALHGDGVAQVLVLTTFDLDEYVFAALRAGAAGFLLKDMEPAELLAAVRIVAAGDALLAPRHTRRLIEAFVAQAGPGPAAADDGELADLTAREREVLALVGQGLSNAEIAERLVLSPLTAKTHVARLFMKLGARDRAQLVVIAYETGLIVPGRRT